LEQTGKSGENQHRHNRTAEVRGSIPLSSTKPLNSKHFVLFSST
jgi:hypothetical protein